MARMKLSDTFSERLYAVIYGREGVGKTRIILSLTKNNGLDTGIITAEKGGPTALITAGYDKNMAVEVVDKGDPFEPAIKAVRDFTRDPNIKVIGLDGVTALCGQAVLHHTDGKGMKSMGYDGWDYVLSSFMALEQALNGAINANKSVIITGWEEPPQYTPDLDNIPQLTRQGGLYLMGKARTWLPGKCDIVARMTSKFKKVPVEGKPGKFAQKFIGELHLHASEEWHAKTRWTLPNPCPADLKFILAQVKDGKVQDAPTTKTVAVVKKQKPAHKGVL